MKKNNNGITIFSAAATIAIVLLSIFGFMAANVIFRFDTLFLESMTLIQLRELLSLTTLGFCAYLTFIYMRDYLELRSGFTLALLFAVLSFMLFAISSNPMLRSACGSKLSPVDIFDLMPLAFSTIAMAILAWVSSK